MSDIARDSDNWPIAIDRVNRTFVCDRCKKTINLPDPGEKTVAAGYGIYHNEIHCYPCCAEVDKEDMQESGKATLYFTPETTNPNRGKITNWPGSLIFPCWYSVGSHNWHGVKRYDCYFKDDKGNHWWGVHLDGGSNQLVRCRKLKHKVDFLK